MSMFAEERAIDRDWLFNECESLVRLEIESMESSGAIAPVRDYRSIADEITYIANILTDMAVKEVLDAGIQYTHSYTVYESQEILDVAIDQILRVL